jgi:glycosyltransferase involved in cell wall biosynthesis
MIDISVTIIFHHEGVFAIPALASMYDLINKARASGLLVEARAILDNVDELTRNIVAVHGEWLDDVEEVSFGDLGSSRNKGVQSSRGKFVAFLDGDDLWGEDWLLLAYNLAASASEEAIWHPESLFYFYEVDFENHSVTKQPNLSARSYHMIHQSSCDVNFNKNSLFLNNLWSANVFAKRDLHLRMPYKMVDRDAGYGIEDWSWNIETVYANIPHLVVPDTVHLIRVKETGSLGQQNNTEGLLVNLPEYIIRNLFK